jgi:predicted lactoylglutathione lyase
MTAPFPPAVPEIPVSSIDKAVNYYTQNLGFTFDWGDEAGGIAGISKGDSRIFLTNAPFRCMHGNAGVVVVWFNVNSKKEVDELHEEWARTNVKIVSPPEDKPWLLREFTAADPDGNHFRVFYDFRHEARGAA